MEAKTVREARGVVDVTEREYFGSIGLPMGEPVPAEASAADEPYWRARRYDRLGRRADWPEDVPGRRRRRHRHHGPPLPFFLLFIFFGVSHLGPLVPVLVLAMLTAALVVTAVALFSQTAIPALRYFSSGALGGSRADRLAPPAARYSPADLGLPGPAAAAQGPDAYRQGLLDVLKERYVRGEIALAEYEVRVAQVVRDPSVKHLG
jgi:hypothetical protein